MQAIPKQIGDFIEENFLFDETIDDIDSSDSFLEMGLIDSTGVLELVSFLEQTFAINIADEELIPDNLDSVNKLIQFVETKVGELAN